MFLGFWTDSPSLENTNYQFSPIYLYSVLEYAVEYE